MMKRILVPIDFSDNSLNAISYARSLFDDVPCAFYLLNVYISTPSKLMSEEYNDEWLDTMSEESKDELKDVLADVNNDKSNPGHVFKMVSKANSIVNAINSFVASENIDYVVMSSKGARGAIDIFLGSNAVKVLNGIDDCPIIIVPQNYLFKAPSQIVFSTNFKRIFHKDELQPLISLVQLRKLKLKIVQVMAEEYLNDLQKTNKESLEKLFIGMNYFFHKIEVSTSESNAIIEFVKQTESNMISFVNHKYNFLQKLTQENVVKMVSFNSPIPVLVLPELS